MKIPTLYEGGAPSRVQNEAAGPLMVQVPESGEETP
jgi:hypothetical protein